MRCLAVNLCTAVVAFLLASLYGDGQDAMVKGLMAQNAALQASITRQMEAAVTEAADAKKMAETAKAEAESAKKKWEGMAKACR